MDLELYSSQLPEYSQQITNDDLLTSLQQLQIFLGAQSLQLKEWGDGVLAVPLTAQVTLPPLGNFEGLDIRQEEPVLFVIDVKNYPVTAPKVYPDRVDFPKDRLAHLYIARGGKPPGFCLIRGNIDEWYADKQIKDLVIRTENWLRDAATGELSEDGNQFEPIRLEGYVGSLVYDYDTLLQIVEQNREYFAGSQFATLQFERMTGDSDYLSWKFLKEIPADKIEEAVKEIFSETEKDDNAPAKRFLYHGYLLWSSSLDTFDTYDVHLPQDWAGLELFCEKYGIDIARFKTELVRTKSIRPYPSIPVIVALKRPKQLIGFSGTIEFMNFHVRLPDESITDEVISPGAAVVFKQHKQPLTPRKAREISGFNGNFKLVSLIAGCGALGSKITLHLAKAGNTSFFLTDPDRLLPHNFVRHALSARDVNVNKAKALAAEINAIFDGLSEKDAVLPIELKANLLLPFAGASELYDWIFDFTASNAFFNKLTKISVHSGTKICKAFITDFGNLGVLFFEGVERNPRVDDLQVLLYAQSIGDAQISDWLQREAAAENHATFISIGVGCNSETTVLSDDVVSLHAASFSGIIKQEATQEDFSRGKIYVHRIMSEPFFQASTTKYDFLPLDIFKAVNDNSWEIRFAHGVIDNLRHQLTAAAPSETGGVFVGCANYKTKTVHVVDVIDAPPDSEANEVCFFRGIEGLPESIDAVNSQTGGQLGYIGEWHTHPNGPNDLSTVDMATVRKFKRSFRDMATPLPVFLMIITPTHILPYVY